MPLKRASRGRRKGGKGSSDRIQCTNCGATVPKDKAKKVTSRLNLVEHTLAKELRAQGAYIASPRILKWYCISCAIHFTWDSSGKNTGVGCHALLQRIFPTRDQTQVNPHCRRILYCLSLQGRPRGRGDGYEGEKQGPPVPEVPCDVPSALHQ